MKECYQAFASQAGRNKEMDPERNRGRILINKIMKLMKYITNNKKDEQA